MIFETIIITVNSLNEPHIAPFGVRYEQDNVIISPYKPSATLDNILVRKIATLNITDDVRIFAGALTGHMKDIALQANTPGHFLSNSLREFDSPCIHEGYRLANALSHMELALIEAKHDDLRPQLIMKKVAEYNHKPFTGFNRAQAAVLELCILVSRLHMLPKDKVMTEMQYLQIAIDKTAGERELEAWGWLVEKIEHFYAEQLGKNQV